MSGPGVAPLLILVPVRSAGEDDPLFLRALGGGRLIDPTLREAARIAAQIDADLCITTDDERIAAHVLENPGWHVRRRKADEIEGGYFRALDIAHGWMAEKAGKSYGAVLILEPSHPFRPAGLIGNAIGIMEREPALDTVVSVVREYGNLWTEDAGGALHRVTTPTGRGFFREVAGLCLLTRPATLGDEKAMGRSVGFVVVEEQWALIDVHGADGVDLARRYHAVLDAESGAA